MALNFSDRSEENVKLTIGNEEIRRGENFTYLSFTISSNERVEQDIFNRTRLD